MMLMYHRGEYEMYCNQQNKSVQPAYLGWNGAAPKKCTTRNGKYAKKLLQYTSMQTSWQKTTLQDLLNEKRNNTMFLSVYGSSEHGLIVSVEGTF